ncbi:hypothetical protein [[Bacillus] enclensis]|uniref:hypothetical protein n=1 Tax=[Bacillus] enclensis TaxID=1402860 RepID=UPI0018DD27EB|nr:hypothetical protein [[Bacillus] enclensis]MBH9968924.1 hypothetical protein [[Bacillus] enclensis]
MKESKSNFEKTFDEIKQSQLRMEKEQERFQKEFAEILSIHSDRIVDHLDNKTETLNKRIYKVESEIERLSRQ